MGNKSDLQQHNLDLSSIKTIAEGLPLEQVIRALASTGQYAWKKYQYNEAVSIENPTIQTVADTSNYYLRITESDYPFANISDPVSFLDGFTHSGGYYGIAKNGTALRLKAGTSSYDAEFKDYTSIGSGYGISCTQISSSGLQSAAGTYTYNGTKVISPASVGDLIGITVDNSPTAYPDGGVQGGYWYERVVEGVAGLDFGEVTLSSTQTSVTVNHGLGVVPSFAALLSDRTTTASTIYANINGTTVSFNTSEQAAVNTVTNDSITFKRNGGSLWQYGARKYYWIAVA